MKKYIYSFLSLVVLLGMTACTEDKPDVGPAPTSDDVTFTMQPTADNPNIIEFTNTTSGSIAYWSFGTGASAKGDQVSAEYAVKGDYEVSLMVVTKGGQATSTQTITIANTDYALLNRADYNFLTGGADSLNGKGWKFDKMTTGHMGIGDPAESTPNWWAANALDKDGRGAYDDLMRFNLNGFKYDLTNNGDTYAKNYERDFFTSRGGTLISEDDDDTWAITFDDQSNWNWSISERDGKSYLQFSGDGFPSWQVGGSQEYEIQTLNEDELYLRTIGGDGNAWYLGFIREGYERPVVPPTPKPYESNDLFDTFMGSSSDVLNLVSDAGLAFTDNFEFNASPASPSQFVGKYERVSGDNPWQNLQSELPFRIDLTSRAVFKMKAYLPSTNDYSGDLAQTVVVKLHDSLQGGNSWQTQEQVVHTITQTDTWVELTFDFSAVSSRTDFDKIIIQIGGEGHQVPGTFYISDFRLEQ
ncbi:hypothetical protein EI427_03830 [Flammeovirga pectinis]|uniref:PKD domain-containing protein n=1 Tax=Flammeovirga pectinis TaxID=2494373 RepID=A0A3S9NZM7_9BACT|nr:PKD domain-containing protein [Flammeovirga pectinis]AZQ61382.1 hypothetical protein EI427_03830 [Flammeovirga pectinis]